MSLQGDSHKLNPGALVDLYILDLNPIGVAQTHYFYPGVGVPVPQDPLTTPGISYLGITYTPWPVEMSGFDKKGSGAETRPKAIISNYGGLITAELDLYDDLVGATVTRRRTLRQYIDNNLPDYIDEIYFIEQKTVEDPTVIEFDMATAMDFIDKRLPGRVAVANACPWRYGSTANGSGCSWPRTDPSKWFDSNDNPVLSVGQDSCGKTLTSCKARFGATNPLDFGGFPSLGRSG